VISKEDIKNILTIFILNNTLDNQKKFKYKLHINLVIFLANNNCNNMF